VITGGLGERHLAVCRRFGESVRAANGKWNRRSPCDAWDARGVLEHVIGFHDVLLLRPLGLKPDRPRDDPQRRWQLTHGQLEKAFELNIGPDATATLANITRDVLVHTWDLARAVGADDRLDPLLCESFYAALPDDPSEVIGSGMFDAPVAVDDRTDVQSKLLARLGRNPGWQAPDNQKS
jgi:uncharacterized protein (TIGR03086 family)